MVLLSLNYKRTLSVIQSDIPMFSVLSILHSKPIRLPFSLHIIYMNVYYIHRLTIHIEIMAAFITEAAIMTFGNKEPRILRKTINC